MIVSHYNFFRSRGQIIESIENRNLKHCRNEILPDSNVAKNVIFQFFFPIFYL